MRFAMISLFILVFSHLSPLSVSQSCVPWGQLCYFRFHVVSKQGREKKKKYWSVMVKWLDPWRSGPQGKGHTSSLPYHVISLICLQWENGNWITWPAPMPRSGLYSKVCQQYPHKVKKKLVVSDWICLLKAHCLAWTLFKAFAFFVECVCACSEGSKKKSEIFKLPPKVIKNVVVAAGDVATEAAAKRRMLIKEEYGKIQENISQNTHSPRHRRRHCP